MDFVNLDLSVDESFGKFNFFVVEKEQQVVGCDTSNNVFKVLMESQLQCS